MSTRVSKNILYTSVSNVLPSLFTFVFWLIIARVAGAEAIGLVSAIASFVVIIATIDVLDLSLGMKRQLGIAISLGDYGKFKQTLVATIILVSVTVTLSAIILSFPSLQILEYVNIDRQYLWIIIPMVAAWAFQHVLSEALVAALQSRKLILPLLTGALARFPILFGIMYFFDLPNIETLLAYSSFFFISTAWYFVYIIKVARKTSVGATGNLWTNLKVVLRAGLASWIPHMISVLGSQLATISVFTIEGAAQGGKFYLPMAIYTLALFIVVGINRVSHPLLAGMRTEDQQRKFLTNNMKIAFILTMPIAVPLMFFPANFLGLVGNEFSSGANTLSIFMIAVPFSIISEMVFYFMYGTGDNKTVLYLGLTSNIPRVILYFALVPAIGSNGAAIAYLAGSLAAVAQSVRVAKVHSLMMNYSNYVILTIIPMAIGLVAWLLSLQFIISTFLIVFGSLLIYVKLCLFTESELHILLYTGLPKNKADKMYPTLSNILRKICQSLKI